MTDPVVKVRIQLDSSTVSASVAEVNAQFATIGSGLNAAVAKASTELDQYGAKSISSFGKVSAGADSSSAAITEMGRVSQTVSDAVLFRWNRAANGIRDASAAAAAESAAAFEVAGAKINTVSDAFLFRGNAAFTKMREAAAAAAAEMQKTAVIVNAFGETEEQAQARISKMTTACLVQIEADKGLEYSTRAILEGLGIRITATAEQTAATRALTEAQDIQAGLVNGFIPTEKAAAGAIAATTVATNVNTEAMTINAGVARELGVLVGEGVAGNFKRMEGSAIVLANRLNLMQAVFSGVGLSIIAAVAAGGLFVDWMIRGALESSALNKAIIATGDYAGVTRQQLQGMAVDIASGTVSIGRAKEAIAAIAATGEFTGAQIKQLGQATVDAGNVMGLSVKEVVADFERLQENPVQAAAKLNSEYHFLTISVYEQIEALQKQGDKLAAAQVAMDAFGAALRQRAIEADSQKGTIERWADNWITGASRIKAAIMDIGKPSTDLQNFQKSRDEYNSTLANYNNNVAQYGGPDGDYAKTAFAEVEAAYKRLQDAQQKVIDNNQKTQSNGLAQQLTQEAVEASTELNKLGVNLDGLNTKQEKLNAAAQALFKIYIAGGKLPAGVAFDPSDAGADHTPFGPGWDKIKKQLDPKDFGGIGVDKAQLGADVQAVREALSQINQAYADSGKLLDEQHKAGLVADADYYDQKRANAQQEAIDQMAELQNEVAADQAALANGALTAAQRIKISEDIQKAYAEESKALEAYVFKDTQLTQQQADAIAKRKSLLDSYVFSLKQEEATLRSSYDVQAQSIGLGSREASDLQKLISLQDEYNKKFAELEKLKGEHKGDEAFYNNEESQLKASYDRRVEITKQGFAEMAAAQADWRNGATSALQDIADKAADVAGQTKTAFENSFTALTGVIDNFLLHGKLSFKSFFDSILAGLAQMASTMISSGIFQAIAGLFGFSANANASGGSGGGGGLGGLLQNGQSLFSGGQNLLGSLFGGGGGGSTAALDAATSIPNYGGSFDFAGANGGTYGFNTATAGTGAAGSGGVGTFGTVASIAGGVLAGLQEFKAAGGGLGGLAGGAAYGTAAYLGGTALAAGGTALLGGAGIAGAGSAALGALGALGPVGWVALAAVLVDKISGGKLFGTSYQTYQTKAGVTIGVDGATAFAEKDQKGQKAFFGGTKYKTVQSDPGQAAGDAANAIYDALQKSFTAGAEAFGVTGAQLVTGSWTTITEYSKKGAVTSTKTISEVLGKQYTETAQDFASRLNSENAIVLADMGGAAGEATKFAQQYRATATTLADAAAVAYQAQLDIHKGNALLGTGATFDATVGLVEKLRGANETLSATYSRLSAETQAIVAGASLLGTTINKSGADLVQFADDFVTAAGGVQSASKLWNDFYANFFSNSERAKAAMDTAKTVSNTALSAIGEDPTESLAKFRADFTAALPSLTAAQIAQWLTAAEYLSAFTKATEAYDQAAGAAANTLSQTAAQLSTVQGILTGNAAALHDAGLTAAQKALEGINKAYDNQRTQLLANAATVDQLNTLEAERNQALINQHAIELKSYTDFETTLSSTLKGLTDTSDAYVKAVLDAQKVQGDQITQANALAIATGKAGASEQDLATIHDITATKIAQAMATLQASAQTLANTLYGTNVDKLTKALTASQQHTADLAGMGMVDTAGFQQQAALQKQIADAQAQAATAARAQQATQLAQMVAEISLGQHESFADVAKSLGFGLDQLAVDLGTNDINAYLQKQQDLAAVQLGIKSAADLSNVLLQRIIDITKGGGFGPSIPFPVPGTGPGLNRGLATHESLSGTSAHHGIESGHVVSIGGNENAPMQANGSRGRAGDGTVVTVRNADSITATHDAELHTMTQTMLTKILAELKLRNTDAPIETNQLVSAITQQRDNGLHTVRVGANRRGEGVTP